MLCDSFALAPLRPGLAPRRQLAGTKAGSFDMVLAMLRTLLVSVLASSVGSIVIMSLPRVNPRLTLIRKMLEQQRARDEVPSKATRRWVKFK